MYTRLLELYCSGQLSDVGLDNAVTKRWITAAQAQAIRDEKARRDADVINVIVTTMLEN